MKIGRHKSSTSNYKMYMTKNHKSYFGTRTNGERQTFQSEHSQVELCIPGGKPTLVIGHIHTDFNKFLNVIPSNECFISPIPDFTNLPENPNADEAFSRKRFIIKIPHCIKRTDQLKHIKVRQGDIHTGEDFRVISQKPRNSTINPASTRTYYEVDKHFVTIYTCQFSQFVCTSCQKTCDGNVTALLFGAHFLAGSQNTVAMLRL